MSLRLSTGGRLIDRSSCLRFTFNGREFSGFQGDTLASALLANDRVLVGRSFKYHRPRGVVASGVEEPNALVGIGEGPTFEPNQCATTIELYERLVAVSQNHWPSLDLDLGVAGSALARFLPAGFYYKMFIHPRGFWKHLYEPLIRRAAGLGNAPRDRDRDIYEHLYVFTDVLVVGGGIAGLQAAKSAAEAGARVLLIEQTAHWGGRASVDGGRIGNLPVEEHIHDLVAELSDMENVTMRLRCTGSGVHDHGYVTGCERLTDHAPDTPGPRHRLWRIRAKQLVVATGAIERPLAFAGNDLPGVMLASAVRDFVVNWAVSAGSRIVVATNNDDGYRTAVALKRAGLDVPRIVDMRPDGGGAMASEACDRGLRIDTGTAIRTVSGGQRVRKVSLCAQAGEGTVTDEIEADAVAMSGGWSPAVHLWCHCGGKLEWDGEGAMFRPDRTRPPRNADGIGFVRTVGAADGRLTLRAILEGARDGGLAAARAVGAGGSVSPAPQATEEAEILLQPVWMLPAKAPVGLRNKAWLDFQNDVKVSDVELAAREGYANVEHAKRYTTLGMATDQGKLSNINGLAILAETLGKAIPDVGTTTFRPPYTPVSMGAIAGEARGDTFQPVRRTPIHDWHDANGADWEPVGQWRRPFAYLRPGESVQDAVRREVSNTRGCVGLLDASTLGKLLVKGQDAGRFLDMVYTNTMSSLEPGRCRYGLMCSENGFLIDDGVVARIDSDAWLCHTTTGGAGRIHAHMEEWLQTEWWDWKVHVTDLTEQYAQITVAGPNARKLLGGLGPMDVSAAALPFMAWADGQLGDHDCRVFRISFSGELSYEIAVPASRGLALWEDLVDMGEALGAMPYGTEALHVMRAEKGFIMIGDETDGTVIPQDLGLHWAISGKKTDFLGKRAQERSHMVDPDRWRLVGLETLDGSVLPEGAYAVGEGRNANGQRNTVGRVTSTYYSPTLGRGIAMGLVRQGPERMGDVLEFPGTDGRTYRARIVSPVFFDPGGDRRNV